MRHLRNPHLRDARVRRTRRVLSGAMAVALVAAAATFVPGGHVEAATQSTSSTYTVLNTNGAVTASLSYSAVSTYNYTKTSANATNSNGDSTLSSKGNQTGDYVQPYDTNNTTTPSLLLSSSYTCAAVTTPVTANTEKDCSSAGTITINFSQPLNNPLLLIGGIGGSSNTTPDNAKFILTSATATGGTPTLSMVGGGGTNQSMQVVGGNTIDNKGFPSTSCVNASSYASGATARAGCGTIQITGTGITSLTFNIVGQMWLAKGTTYGGQVIQNGTSDTLDEYTLAIANSSPTPKPFTCTTSTVYNANGSPTQMNVQYAGSTTFTKLGAASGWLYNAIGYDAYNGINLIYAVSQTSPTNTTAYPANHLLAIDATGAVNDLGAITGISTTGASAATTDSGNINSGFIDDSGNFWFLDSNGTAILYEITAANLAKATSQNNSLSSTPATTFTAQGTTKIVAPDLTYANGYAWGIQNATNTIYRVNLSTGAVSTYTVSGLPAGSWGAAWTYANGNLGFDNNSATSTTGLAQISVANPSGTPTFTVVSNTGGPASSSNDGTACKSTANVAITKAASTSQDPAAGATVATGATVTWTLTITGQGPGNASGALVTDTLPSGYTNIAVVGSTAATNACTISGQTVTCNDGFGAAGLAPGATATVTITATAPTTIGTCLSNTASILGNDATNGTQNSNSVPTCTVAVPVSLSIVKSATTNPSPLTGAGQTITYSFLVTNTSAAAPVTGIKVTDAMTGLSAVSCPQTTLAAGSSETCTATYTTTGADVSAGSVTNPSATVTGTGPSGNTVTGTSNTVTVKIVWSPICGADGTAVLYSSQANGNVKQVSITGGAATTTTLTGWAGLSGVQNSGDSQVNGIGITPDGSALYALQRNDPGNNVVEMLKWTASTGWTAVANSAFTTALTGNGAIVAGAVDPVNGVYYFGGTNYVSGTGSVFLLYSWNPATNTFASVGQVPLQDSATASQGHSGDLVFDQSGNLFLESAIVGGNSTPPAQITAVPAAQLATATGGTISANTSRVAVTTAIRDFNGIAMDLSGNVWMGDEPDLVEANPSTGAQVGTTLASAVAPHSTDLASCNPATSLIVQKSIASRVAAAGWRPVNCDVTIHAQRPKLSAYKPALRENLAVLLGLPVAAVNVKAKTGEHVGPIGRGEAISCDAAILLTASTQD